MKSSKFIKILLIVLAVLIVIGFVAVKVIINKTFNFAFRRNKEFDTLTDEQKQWLDNANVQEVSINSFDNLKLQGYLIENHETDNYLILVHGIWSSHNFMVPLARKFNKLGYNILLIDQRSAGKSEGDYFTYGYKESIDVKAWSDYLIERNKNIKIALLGVSMGASTCMMTTRLDLQENVKCIIEDCGYSELRQQFKHFLEVQFKLPKQDLLINIVEKTVIKKLGFKIDDVSPKKYLQTNTIPMMFIHGEKDNFVPFKMAKELFDVNTSEKIYYPTVGINHGMSFTTEKYFDDVDAFIKKYF